MTVLCVNSGVTYADIASAVASEGGTSYGTFTLYEQSGTSTTSVIFTQIDHPDSFKYTAKAGEETTGDIAVGAGTTAAITSTVADCQITDLRTASVTLTSATNPVIRRLVVDSGGADGVIFPNSIDAEDILIHNCDDGFLSSVVRTLNTINKCTVVGAGRFGFAQGVFTNCVDVNSANQGFFNEQSGSANNWEHDGTGTNTITESPPTDIFEDYAAGDYRIKSTSSPGVAGAGAFINVATGGVTGDVDFTISKPVFSASGTATLPAPSGDISFTIDKPVFTASGSATLPQPSGDVSFIVSKPIFSADGSATLPQPSGVVSFSVNKPVFTASGSATVPFPQGDIAFTVNKPLFSATGSATQPSPSGSIDFEINKPVFSATGEATLPNPSGIVDFTIDKPIFSATGSVTLPYPQGSVSFTVNKPQFSVTGSVTLPQPSGSVSFSVSKPVFAATGTVSGLEIPIGTVLTPTFGSNTIKLPYTSNTIKL